MTPAPSTLDVSGINLRWLLRLRWGAALGQSVVILSVKQWMGVALPLVPLFILIGIEVLSNIGLSYWSRRATNIATGILAAVIALDILLLTGLLYFAGGSFNPFNFLYLVYIALAAIVLRASWAWALLVLSLLSFGALFIVEDTSDHLGHAAQMQMHLQGMWVAFAVASVFIVYFVGRTQRALVQREQELTRARELAGKSEKLASLATLAAGAAHELSTPLSTIALVAGELESALARGDHSSISRDAQLVRREVERCRSILQGMSRDAGDNLGEPLSTIPLAELMHAALDDLPVKNPVEQQFDANLDEAVLQVPIKALSQVIRGLIHNASDASSADSPIQIEVRSDERGYAITIRDEGSGMAPDVLERATEPFFTTKAPGQGMGLGLFLTQALLERLDGRFSITSELDEGTEATLWLPRHIPTLQT